MGRKGVSKRKKAKEKVAPVQESVAALTGKAETRPERVMEKPKAKGNRKR